MTGQSITSKWMLSTLRAPRHFTAQLSGWTFTDYGPDYCEFSDGLMKGGFAAAKRARTGGPLVVLYGHDLAEIQQAVEEAGGTIVQPVFSFPGGSRFHFTDPDGYELAVWRAD